jgi:hypothetical protein
MKSLRLLLIFVGVLAVHCAVAQAPKSQRFVLLEEFTSTTCGPCAGVNPTLHALQVNNPTKFTSIYYHVNWPAPGDPMNLHNPAESAARVSYYGVSYVPYGRLDGNYWSGNPSGLNINTINARYAMPAPMEMDLQHALSAGNDSIFVTMLLKATDNIPAGNIAAHNVVIEKHIHFNSAPGSNGEKDFYNVMKKMLPGSSGTKIEQAMAPGDYMILENAWKLANVYDINELAAVGFVQNNASKEVFQTANSSTNAPTPLYANDAEILTIDKTSPTNCLGQLSPRIKVRNNGSSDLTSLLIKYEVNGGTPMEYTWNGSVDFLNKFFITLPAYSFTVAPQNELKVYVSQVNGNNDEYPKNDTLSFAFEDGVQAENVINIWIKTDNNPQETTWKIVDSNGNTVGSGGPYATAGTLYKEVVTLPTDDECYSFFMFDAGANGLCCTNGMGFFTCFYGNNKVIAEGTTFGDEILAQFHVGSGVGLLDRADAGLLNISPNPAHDNLRVYVSLMNPQGAELNIYDLRGQRVYHSGIAIDGKQQQVIDLDVSGLAVGMYVAEVVSNGQVLRKKFSLK